MAVKQALKDRLTRIERYQSKATLEGELSAIAAHANKLPILDQCSIEGILGLDENGLPQ